MNHKANGVSIDKEGESLGNSSWTFNVEIDIQPLKAAHDRFLAATLCCLYAAHRPLSTVRAIRDAQICPEAN